MKLEKNKQLIDQFYTRPLKEKPWRGKNAFWWKDWRLKFKRDVQKCKYAWYENWEVAEYFNIWLQTINVITAELGKETKELYWKERLQLLVEQVRTVDEVIFDLKKDISQLKPKERWLKLKYLTTLDWYLKERAKLLWLTQNTLLINNTEDPIEEILKKLESE